MAILKDPERKEVHQLHKLVQLSGKRVLEIGCGDGRFTWRYAGTADRITGIDPDGEALKTALSTCPVLLRGKIALAQANAVTLPHPHDIFDLAILSWSL